VQEKQRKNVFSDTSFDCVTMQLDMGSGADFMGHGGTCPHFYKWLGTERAL